jgi:hypothetical protein
LAKRLRDELMQMAWDSRAQWVYEVEPLASSVARAKSLTDYPVMLLDHYDNAASGGTMDTTAVLAEVLRQGLRNVAVFAIFDPQAVQEAIAAGIGVEEFVEEDEVLPCGVGGVAAVATVAGAVTVCIWFEEPAHAAGDFVGCLLEGDVVTAAGGQFDSEATAVEMVIAFKRLDDEVGDGEPDRAAPV